MDTGVSAEEFTEFRYLRALRYGGLDGMAWIEISEAFLWLNLSLDTEQAAASVSMAHRQRGHRLNHVAIRGERASARPLKDTASMEFSQLHSEAVVKR